MKGEINYVNVSDIIPNRFQPRKNFNQDELQELAESRSGTFPQITFDEIKSLNIDLPSKDFQQHIVNIQSEVKLCF